MKKETKKKVKGWIGTIVTILILIMFYKVMMFIFVVSVVSFTYMAVETGNTALLEKIPGVVRVITAEFVILMVMLWVYFASKNFN